MEDIDGEFDDSDGRTGGHEVRQYKCRTCQTHQVDLVCFRPGMYVSFRVWYARWKRLTSSVDRWDH